MPKINISEHTRLKPRKFNSGDFELDDLEKGVVNFYRTCIFIAEDLDEFVVTSNGGRTWTVLPHKEPLALTTHRVFIGEHDNFIHDKCGYCYYSLEPGKNLQPLCRTAVSQARSCTPSRVGSVGTHPRIRTSRKYSLRSRRTA